MKDNFSLTVESRHTDGEQCAVDNVHHRTSFIYLNTIHHTYCYFNITLSTITLIVILILRFVQLRIQGNLHFEPLKRTLSDNPLLGSFTTEVWQKLLASTNPQKDPSKAIYFRQIKSFFISNELANPNYKPNNSNPFKKARPR
jgi:hypothetical protein